MEKVFETENVVLYNDGEKVVGNVSKEEAYKALEQAGVDALCNLDFETVLSTATLATKVITDYEQLKEESSVKDDEILNNLLQIVKEAYEDNRIDELFSKLVLVSKLEDKSIIDFIKESQKG